TDSAKHEVDEFDPRWEARLRVADGTVSLPDSRTWDLIPESLPIHLAVGVRWTDRVDRRAANTGFEQLIHGIRASRVLRDTMIGAVRCWWIRDTLTARFFERDVDFERTLHAEVHVDHDPRGTIHSEYLIDPSTRRILIRDDTAAFRGTSTLYY